MNTKSLLLGSLLSASILAQAAEPPIMDWTFSQQPALGAVITDSTGKVSGELLPAAEGGDKVPQLLKEGVPCGTAWDFGDSDTIFAVTPDAAIQSLGNVTATKGMAFAFWVKKDNADKAATHRRVFGWGPVGIDCSAGNDVLHFITSGFPEGADPAEFEKRGGAVSAANAVGVLDGAWHHLVFSADFTKKESNAVLYVDGAEVQRNSVDFSNIKNFKPGKMFFIGGRFNSGNRWTGSIGRFQAWNRALSTEEVAKLTPVKK